MSIAAGSLDIPTGLDGVDHIFFEDASDYYKIHPAEQIRKNNEIEDV